MADEAQEAAATDTASPPPSAALPGPRASTLLQLHSQTLSATLRSISYASFAACFPTIAARAPGALQRMHAEFVSKLGRFAEEDWRGIVRERAVVEGLNGLEEVLASARRRRIVGSEEAGGAGAGGGGGAGGRVA